ncbi:MAG TPA: response regulator, partial [Terriglobales bacterium]|nr:response regulator [Terriglobales bacterium]
MASGRILVVDDDSNLVELVKMRLEAAGYDVTTALTEEEAVSAMKAKPLDLCLLDLMLTNRDGIALMEEIHAIIPEVPAIILTAHGTIESAVEAMRKGAYSYLTKPFEPQDLLLQIDRALEHRRLNTEIKRLKGLLAEKYDFANIIARSARMRDVLDI